MAITEMVKLECVGGPWDGSFVPAVGTQLVAKQFEKSPTSYLYRRALDDTGAPFWEFAGIVEQAA